MIDQHQDDVVSAYRAGIKELAEEYDAGAISENKVWQEMCKKKKDDFSCNRFKTGKIIGSQSCNVSDESELCG